MAVQILSSKVFYMRKTLTGPRFAKFSFSLQGEEFRAWHSPAMLGCSTVCPNCQHEFACCRPKQQQCCCNNNINTSRALHGLSGGCMVTTLAAPSSPCHSPQVSPSTPIAFFLTPPEDELKTLSTTVKALRLSGW